MARSVTNHPLVNKLLSHEVQVRDVIGDRMHLTLRQLQAAIFNSNFLIFWMLLTSMLVVLDFHGVIPRSSIPGAAFVWAGSILGHLAVYTLLLVAWGMIERGLNRTIPLIRPIASIPVAITNTFLTHRLVALVADSPYTLEETVSHLVTNCALAQILEIIFFCLCLASYRPDNEFGHFQVEEIRKRRQSRLGDHSR